MQAKSAVGAAFAYTTAVGILSDSNNCISCHNSNGPWKDESKYRGLVTMDTLPCTKSLYEITVRHAGASPTLW